MADRVYLEKLLYLYQELKECFPPLFKSQVDLIRKTIEFYGVVDGRLTYIWEKVNRIARLHFKIRHNIAEKSLPFFNRTTQRVSETDTRTPGRRASETAQACRNYGKAFPDDLSVIGRLP
ncbi:MAG: hypothetical protein HC887_10595 [Desulfobacteraceae bacterium]|nr:hypothetical protein [Desulfobacteraceae bacterium]